MNRIELVKMAADMLAERIEKTARSTTSAILGKTRWATTQPADASGDTRTNMFQMFSSPAGLAAKDAYTMSNADLMAVIDELSAAHSAGNVKSLGLHPRISKPEYLDGLMLVARSRGLLD